MVRKVDVEYLLSVAGTTCIIDVRTPAEYHRGHIPGAVNVPLFSNDERSEVGTLYKRSGPERAILRGLEMVGPRMHTIPGRVMEVSRGREILLHCWRGGKRSASMAWLLDMTGTGGARISVLEGGYKAFRQYARLYFEGLDQQFVVLGGRTGSGKTQILHALHRAGEQVVDLEDLARHKGSAFGWIGEEEQPTTEHFENLVFSRLVALDVRKPVWLENESRSIGRVFIPSAMWARMKDSPLIQLEVATEERVDRLVAMYTGGDYLPMLREAFIKISKRLGGQNVNEALRALDDGDYQHAAQVALRYYDKTYAFNLAHNTAPVIRRFSAQPDTTVEERAQELAMLARQITTTLAE